MRQVNVRFGTGQEVLNAYWGFLSDGGLVIPDQDGFAEGVAVSVRVQIASSQTQYELFGRIVRRDAARHAVVAFDPGEPHDMLLTAALSETDDVPARRHKRHQLKKRAEVLNGDGRAPVTGRMLDVSRAGCCVRLDGATAGAFPNGTSVTVLVDGMRASGTVVWARGADRGVSFDEAGCIAAESFIDSL